MIEAVLQHQWVEDQPAIDTATDNQAWRQFRLPLLDHQTFALLTSHGFSSLNKIYGGIESSRTQKAR
jgi:hypothetical protein